MRRPIRGRSARLALAATALGLLVLAGCAKKGPPSGGPPDLEPPRILSTYPDSGAANVPRDAQFSITFSEGMEPRSSGDAIETLPRLDIRQRRWSGRTLTLVLRDTLRHDHAYTMYVGSGAHDRHGNNLVGVKTIVFTTAPAFPPGVIEGRIEGIGFTPAGVLIWCYHDGRRPDSTARDFDALGVTDAQGHFRVSGLDVPGKWRFWAFADLNNNRSFEPDADLLAPYDSLISLSPERPVVANLLLRVVNPRAPGRFAGTIVDSVSDSTGLARLIVTSNADSTRHVLYDVPDNGSFDFKFQPGTYHVRAFRDRDRNKAWQRDREPASEEQVLVVTPGGTLSGVKFVLLRPQPGAAADTTASPPPKGP